MLNAWVDLLGDPLNAPQYALSHLFLFAPTDAAMKALNCSDLTKLPTTKALSKADFINDADQMLQSGRAAMLVFPIVLGALIFFWSLELWGLAGAIISLAFFCFNPNTIANGGLMTLDLPVACFFCATIYCFWRLTAKFSAANFAALCLSFGLAQTVKYSAVLLAPLLLLLLAVQACRKQSWQLPAIGKLSPGGGRTVISAAIFGACLLSAVLCIWWQFDFRYDVAPNKQAAIRQMLDVHPDFAQSDAFALGHLPLETELRTAEAVRSLKKQFPDGNAVYADKPLNYCGLFDSQIVNRALPDHPRSLLSALCLFINKHHLLPEAYTFGFMLIMDQMTCRQSYLLGQVSFQGFPLYYLYAFLLKDPLIMLAGLPVCLIMLVQIARNRRFDVACLVLPIVVYGAVAFFSRFNIGIRHLLPIYPFLFVLLGLLANIRLPKLLQAHSKITLAAFVLCIAVSSTFVFAPLGKVQCVFPDYLTYFNELAGGPSNGSRYLLDSNLDWGQGLKLLASWLKTHGVSKPIYLCYCGQADPLYEGIAFQQVIGGSCPVSSVDFAAIKAPSYFAISANPLHGLGVSPRFRPAVDDFIKHRCAFEDLVDNSIFVYKVVR